MEGVEDALVRIKEEQAAYQKASYEQHKPEILARQKVYRALQQEKLVALKKAYYQKHRKQIIARVKAYQTKHKKDSTHTNDEMMRERNDEKDG